MYNDIFRPPPIRINKSQRVVKSEIVGREPPHLVSFRIKVMPHSQLRVLHSRPVVVFLQPASIAKLLTLPRLPVIAVFVVGVLWLERLSAYSWHCQHRRIIVMLL